MFVFIASKNKLIAKQKEFVTSGSANVYKANFMFDSTWCGLKRTAVFKAGNKTVSVLLDCCGICNIPWEVLEKDGLDLFVGVYGSKDGDIILPTTWCNVGTIKKGTTLGDEPVPPTPGLYEQILDQMQNIADTTLKDAREESESAKESAEKAMKSAEEAEKSASITKSYIENMEVSCDKLPSGSAPTVQKNITEDSINIHFGIPSVEDIGEIENNEIFNIWKS